MNSVQGIHHYALVVADLKQSIQWYQDTFEFQLEREFAFDDVGLKIAHIITDSGLRIELLEQSGSAPSPDLGRDVFSALYTQGAKHIGFQVSNIEAVAQKLQQQGIEFVLPITVVEPAGVRNLWIRDNSGNLIEIVQPLS